MGLSINRKAQIQDDFIKNLNMIEYEYVLLELHNFFSPFAK